jgi:hypothetical protein
MREMSRKRLAASLIETDVSPLPSTRSFKIALRELKSGRATSPHRHDIPPSVQTTDLSCVKYLGNFARIKYWLQSEGITQQCSGGEAESLCLTREN